MPLFPPSATQDLSLWFLEGSDGLVGGLNYNTDIFTAATAEGLAARFTAMLEAIIEAPHGSVHQLSSPTPRELTLLREQAGLTVRQVASKVGVQGAHSTIGDWFAGRGLPSTSSVELLMALLAVWV